MLMVENGNVLLLNLSIRYMKTENNNSKKYSRDIQKEVLWISVMICIFLWSEMSQNNINGNKDVKMPTLNIL